MGGTRCNNVSGLQGVLPGAAGAPEVPQAAPGQAKPGQTELGSRKATQRANGTQAGKLQNSAKGKVFKATLAMFLKSRLTWSDPEVDDQCKKDHA